jgi:hypothetical protein
MVLAISATASSSLLAFVAEVERGLALAAVIQATSTGRPSRRPTRLAVTSELGAILSLPLEPRALAVERLGSKTRLPALSAFCERFFAFLISKGEEEVEDDEYIADKVVPGLMSRLAHPAYGYYCWFCSCFCYCCCCCCCSLWAGKDGYDDGDGKSCP